MLICRLAPGVLLLAAAAAPSARAAETYAIDASHTSIIFGVKHMQFSYTYGRFNTANGTFALDAADPAACSFQLNIETASVDTNDAKRDEHLRGPDFFDAGQYPAITFASTKIEAPAANSKTWKVTGDLTIHGTTRPVTLELVQLGEGQGMAGEKRTGFLCQTKIKRSEFGMTNHIPMIGDEVAVTVSFEGGVQ